MQLFKRVDEKLSEIGFVKTGESKQFGLHMKELISNIIMCNVLTYYIKLVENTLFNRIKRMLIQRSLITQLDYLYMRQSWH